MESERQGAVKAIVERMEEGLQRSNTKSDDYLLRVHGQDMVNASPPVDVTGLTKTTIWTDLQESLIRELWDVPTEQRSCYMGRMVTGFCTDFIAKRLALSKGNQYTFRRKWEVSLSPILQY